MTETAIGGMPGGAGTSTGERVVVRYADDEVRIFTEANTFHYYAPMVTKFELRQSISPVGQELVIGVGRQGAIIPVRFEGQNKTVLERLMAAVLKSNY